MGKNSKPNFPSPPQFQPDPFLTKTQQGLFDTGDALRQGRFQDPNDPTVGFLNDLVSLNPEATQRAVGLASRDIIDTRDRAQQDILNQLEANNQLTSSVTGNRLADLNEAFSSDIADVSTNFFLADVERAFSNTSALFGAGLETLNAVGDRGLANQQQVNTFAENRFSSEVALESERFNRQLQNEQEDAALFGSFLGPGGGALAGFISGGSSAANAGFASGLNSPFAGLGGLIGGFGQGSSSSGFSGVTSSGPGTDVGFSRRSDLLKQRAIGGTA